MKKEDEVVVSEEVGTIVWVRRKNGSWWPGKILGCQHLSAPRPGATPVKLLGREDASIAWYNFKKSKRVKPFRCGEFDDCIQRAQAMPPKKRKKYARRENAILHALKLEKQLLHNKCPTPVALNSKPGDVTQLSSESGPNNQVNRRSTRVTRPPARLMHLSPKDTVQRKRPRLYDHNQPTPKLPNPMPLQLLLDGIAAAASGDSSDHAPDHLLSEKTKPSPKGEEEDSQSDSSGTESLKSDTFDVCLATLSAESTGRGTDADTGNKQLVDRLQKELLNEKQRNQQMETELVAVKRERDFALSELEEVKQQLKKQKGDYKKECEVENAGN